MLRKIAPIWLWAVVLAAAGAARADMIGTLDASPPAGPAGIELCSTTAPVAGGHALFDDWALAGEDPLPDAFPSHRPASIPSEHSQLRQLPPEPGTAALLAAGLGSLGLWQLGRSAKKFHLSHIPAWYHSAGPGQIGHAYALNPDLSGVEAWCGEFFRSPATDGGASAIVRGDPLIKDPQEILLSSAPRGPPLCASPERFV